MWNNVLKMGIRLLTQHEQQLKRFCTIFFLKWCFFKGSHHPSGSFINWAHVTSLQRKTNLQSTNTFHTWNDN